MCGICGQYNFGTREPVVPETIRRMSDSIVHRGPDDEGFHFDGPLGLGFRRLSIIDLAGGHQPMTDQEESVWVVFNGEIYNFPEIKAELEGYGYKFRTQSDTEVLVHGYKKWGVEVFNHLNGMFGVAIWDVAKKRLVLARDAFGIKLVYYKLKNGSLYFGSEIRAIRAADAEPVEVDPVSLNLFLRYRFTPSPYTIYKGINKLAPGTMLIAEPGSTRVERWYAFKPEPFSPIRNVTEGWNVSVESFAIAGRQNGYCAGSGISGRFRSTWRRYGKASTNRCLANHAGNNVLRFQLDAERTVVFLAALDHRALHATVALGQVARFAADAGFSLRLQRLVQVARSVAFEVEVEVRVLRL